MPGNRGARRPMAALSANQRAEFFFAAASFPAGGITITAGRIKMPGRWRPPPQPSPGVPAEYPGEGVMHPQKLARTVWRSRIAAFQMGT